MHIQIVKCPGGLGDRENGLGSEHDSRKIINTGELIA